MSIVLTTESTTVNVLPDRGAIVTSVVTGGTELLYLEPDTIASPTGAIRGGIPLLFPFAGELADGRLSASGTEMPRHGFARRKAWRVVERTASTVTMRLPIDAEISAGYPYAFGVDYVVSALAHGVRLDLIVENRSERSLPLAPGWHPYFPCPVGAKRACLLHVVPAAILPPEEPLACDVNVAAPGGRSVFPLADAGVFTLTFSAHLRTLEVWTLAGKPFVCVEPWVGPSNVINTTERVSVPPGGREHMWMAIERLPA